MTLYSGIKASFCVFFWFGGSPLVMTLLGMSSLDVNNGNNPEREVKGQGLGSSSCLCDPEHIT